MSLIHISPSQSSVSSFVPYKTKRFFYFFLMNLPRELITYILTIKYHTAWKTRLNKIHTLLSTTLTQNEEFAKIRIYPSRQTTCYATNFFNFEVSETRERTYITRYIFIYKPRVKVWIPPPEEFRISFQRRDLIWIITPDAFMYYFYASINNEDDTSL